MVVGTVCHAQVPTTAPDSQTLTQPVGYPVNFTVSYDGRIQGTPMMLIGEGQSSSIAVSRKNGVMLRTLLTRQIVGGRSVARLDVEVFRKIDDRWQAISTPVLMMPVGGTARFVLERPRGGEPILRLDATVGQPVVRLDGKRSDTSAL